MNAFSFILKHQKHFEELPDELGDPLVARELSSIYFDRLIKATKNELKKLPSSFRVLAQYKDGAYLVLENPSILSFVPALPKAEQYDDYYNTLDVEPFDHVLNAPTNKKEQWAPRRRKLDTTDRATFFEEGLHETVDTDDANRSLVPFGSQTLAWDIMHYDSQPAFDKLEKALDGKEKRKIKRNTWLKKDASEYVLQYHSTDIVTFYENHIRMYTGGWVTLTTTSRINYGLKLAGIQGGVFRKKDQMYYVKQNDWDTWYMFDHDELYIEWNGDPKYIEEEQIIRKKKKVEVQDVPNTQENLGFEEGTAQEENSEPQNVTGSRSVESFDNEEIPSDSSKIVVTYPTSEEIIDLHNSMVNRYGGLPSLFPDTEDKLNAAIGRMQSGMSDTEFFKSIEEKASVLLHSIVTSHPFPDGNKRTGLGATVKFLMTNGKVLEDSEDLETLIIHVADDSVKYDQILKWIKSHIESSSNRTASVEDMISYPDVEDIMDAHDYVLSQFGGKDGMFPETEAKLSAALGRMQSSAFGEDLFSTVVEKASALIHSIVTSHPFPDGNKRTAYLAAMEFLYDNGHYVVDPGNVVGAIHLMAESEGASDTIFEALRDNTKSLREKHHDNLRNLS